MVDNNKSGKIGNNLDLSQGVDVFDLYFGENREAEMVCPGCGATYLKGIDKCEDCKTLLMARDKFIKQLKQTQPHRKFLGIIKEVIENMLFWR
ncbi:MAG: hypothetical protein ABIH69_05870 [bacterium]